MTRPLFAFDTETFLITPGCQAPPLVCLQFAVDGSAPQLIHARDPACKQWITYALENYLLSAHNVAFDMAVLCAWDHELIPTIFDAYDADRITCTIARQKLIEIATGRFKVLSKQGYYLDKVAQRLHVDLQIDKEDPWRLRYGTLHNVPLEQWPQDAKHYALNDAVAQRLVHRAQDKYAADKGIPLVDQFRQARAAFWIRLMECRGMMVDPRRVGEYIAGVQASLDEDRVTAIAAGLIRPDGSADTKAAMRRMVEVCRAAEEPDLPITDTGEKRLRAELKLTERQPIPRGATWGLWQRTLAESQAEINAQIAKWQQRQAKSKRQLKPLDPAKLIPCGEYVKLDEDACDLFGDAELESYQRCRTASTQIARALRLRAAAQAGKPIQARFGTLQDTGRTSCSQGDDTSTAFGFQLQNPAKDKKLKSGKLRKGTREVFVPRGHPALGPRNGPEFWYCSTDYGSMELCGWAQECLWRVGHSKLAKVINAGRDPHVELAATLARISVEEAYARRKGLRGPELKKEFDNKFRQAAKVANFGFPGGMGAAKMVLAARKQYNVELTLQGAKDLRQAWLQTWPEAADYFDYINRLLGGRETGRLVQSWSGRARGGCYYSQLANTGFQGLCADIAKQACWEISREMYARPASPLYGSFLVNFLHDEPFSEVLADRAHEAAHRQAQIQIEVAQRIAPDLKWSSEPALMRRWYKDAEARYVDEQGRPAKSGRLVPWEPDVAWEIESVPAQQMQQPGVAA